MYEVKVESGFSAAHSLRGYQGKCERLHGHNYRIEVVLGGPQLDALGMLVDFSHVRGIVDKVIGGLDHAHLNDVEPFTTQNPTSERIARHIAEQVAGELPQGVALRRVVCWESECSAATYIPD